MSKRDVIVFFLHEAQRFEPVCRQAGMLCFNAV